MSAEAVAKNEALAALFTNDFRVLNVKQPWATALIKGIKNVENRPNSLKMDHFPGWVAILASGSQPTKCELENLTTRMLSSGQEKRLGELPTRPREYPMKYIVGVLRFERSYTHEEMAVRPPSVWYNGAPDIGWVVDTAIEFAHPIGPVEGSLSLRRLSNFPEPLKTLLQNEMRKELGERSE